MVILINTLTVLTMIPFGVQIAGAVFVGNCMGQGKPRKAKEYSKLLVLYTFLCLTVVCSLLLLFKERVAQLFTNQPDLLAIVTANYQWVALFLIVHGIGMSLGGALRGMGK